jgi:DNA-binding ferritin-like protein
MKSNTNIEENDPIHLLFKRQSREMTLELFGANEKLGELGQRTLGSFKELQDLSYVKEKTNKLDLDEVIYSPI